MQKNADLYDFIQNLQGLMYQAGLKHYAETTPADQQIQDPDYPPIMHIRRGYAESVTWMLVQLYEFHPEPLTVDTFRVRAVYSAPRLSQALLELIASEGWAHRDGDNYVLSNTGLDVIQTMLNQRSTKFQSFCPLTSDKLDTLIHYSDRIFTHAINTYNDRATWCLCHSQNRKPTDVSPIASLIHICSDFNAWRDDCHMSAYREQHVDGMTWEAFAFVDDKKAKTASELFEKLAYRGWTLNEWQTTLNQLCDKSWIKKDKDKYTSTDAGKSIRQTVEAKTDELFYSTWDALTESEQTEYIHLLKELDDACVNILND